MAEQPLVSVVIATYNRAALLREAVESVLSQTFRDFELIVVDDGSADGTEAVMSRMGGSVQLLRQANAGVNAARNAGIRSARGRYIALLDDDDFWEPWKLQLQTHLLRSNPDTGFCFTDFFIYRSPLDRSRRGLESWHVQNPAWREALTPQAPLERASWAPDLDEAPAVVPVRLGDVYGPSLHSPYVLPTTAMFRREVFDETGGFPESDPICGDWEFFSRASRDHGCLFAEVETAFNRSHEDRFRLTRSAHDLQLERRIAMVDRLWARDVDFMQTNGAQVRSRQRQLRVELSKMRLYAGNRRSARKTLREAARFGSDRATNEGRLRCLASIPLMGLMLRGARGFRDAIWR